MPRTSGSDAINAYLQAVVRAHLGREGAESDAAFARKCGVTPGAINAIKNRAAGGGMRLLEAVAHGLGRHPWELYREAMGGSSWAPGMPPLRALPSWPEAAKMASQMADPKLVDEVGGFVPPAHVSVVTGLALLDLVRALTAMRAAALDVDVESGELVEDDALPLVVDPPASTRAKRA